MSCEFDNNIFLSRLIYCNKIEIQCLNTYVHTKCIKPRHSVFVQFFLNIFESMCTLNEVGCGAGLIQTPYL